MTRSRYFADTAALEFGPFRLIPATCKLSYGNRRVNLGSRAGAILVQLVENAGELVASTELLARVWPVAKVNSGTLRVHVAFLRKTFNQLAGESDYIHTIHGHGYRFVMPVRHVLNLFESFEPARQQTYC
jgi:DNA-binding winged helix-turn-helix (wHTH) protein